jgi:hypothetical protein
LKLGALKLGPALGVFLIAQALYFATASGWPWRVPDEYEVYFQTESLVERGSLAIPQLKAREKELFFGEHGRDGQLYAPYGPFVAYCAAPFYLLARLVTDVGDERAGLTTLAAATAGALAVAGFFRAARRRTNEKDALLLSLALALSVLWPYSKSFFSEAFSAAALIWAWVLCEEERLPSAVALIALACLLKATNVFFALPLALARPERWRLLLGVVAAGLVHMQWNSHRFGDFRDFGYNWGEFIRGTPRPFGGSFFRGLTVLLLSPGKSIFIWAPCVLLALPHLRKEKPIALTALVGLVVFSVYMWPEGGYCHGPRHLVPLLPLLLLPAAHGSSRRALVPLIILGAAMNALAASTSYLEDQALGDPPTRDVYYVIDETVPDGLPRNVYRLGYLPQVSLPATLLSSPVTSTPQAGVGLDLFCRHARGWVRFLPLGLGIVSLALGLLTLRSPLLRKENAAILPARDP